MGEAHPAPGRGRPGLGIAAGGSGGACSRSQRRCAHVGNLAMPGESLPLRGSSPQPGLGTTCSHHAGRAGWVDGGRSSFWSALLPPPWRPGTHLHSPHHPPPQPQWTHSIPKGEPKGRLCGIPPQRGTAAGCAAGPLLRVLGRPTCVGLDSLSPSLLSKNWFCKRPSLCLCHHSHFDLCLSEEVVTQGRQVPGTPARVVVVVVA